MVWDCTEVNGVDKIPFIEDIIDAKTYLIILKDNLFESVGVIAIETTFIFNKTIFSNIPRKLCLLLNKLELLGYLIRMNRSNI